MSFKLTLLVQQPLRTHQTLLWQILYNWHSKKWCHNWTESGPSERELEWFGSVFQDVNIEWQRKNISLAYTQEIKTEQLRWVFTYRTVHQTWWTCHWYCALRGQLSPSGTFLQMYFQAWLDRGLELNPTGLGSPSDKPLTDLRNRISVISSLLCWCDVAVMTLNYCHNCCVKSLTTWI